MSDDFTSSRSGAFSLARQVVRQAPENLFGLRPGTIRHLDEVASDSGDVSVRCEEWQHFPHIDLTHTETSLHVDEDGPCISELSWPVITDACVATIAAATLRSTHETGPSNALPDDWVITSKQLSKLQLKSGGALTIFARSPRTDTRPPHPTYFTHEAMQLIVDQDIQHLLFSEFSVDREDDNGELHNHRLFWNLPIRPPVDTQNQPPPSATTSTASGRSASATPRYASATITENIARPKDLSDGLYILVLNPMPAQSDASPSAPLLLTRSECA